MKVIVCGGRNFEANGFISDVLDGIHAETPIECVYQGGARGADRGGKLWAEARGISCITFPADWEHHRLAAGPIRNKQMVTHVAEFSERMAVAFPGGRGTADLIRQATSAGIPVRRVRLADYLPAGQKKSCLSG